MENKKKSYHFCLLLIAVILVFSCDNKSIAELLSLNSIEIAESMELEVGEIKKIEVLAYNVGENNQGSLKWESSDQEIVSVSSEGEVTGIKIGEVQVVVSVKENSEVTDSITITVIKAIDVNTTGDDDNSDDDIQGSADKTELIEEIDKAFALLTGTGVGSSIGMVSQEQSNNLSDVLGLSIAVRDNESASQDSVDKAVSDLIEAVASFKEDIIKQPPSGNIVFNGDFSEIDDLNDNNNEPNQWSIWSGVDGATGTNVSGAAVITITNVGNEHWENQFWQKGMDVPYGGTYVVTFTGSADVETDINLTILPTACAVDNGGNYTFTLTSSPETFQASFNIFGVNAGATLETRFNLGKVTANSVPAVITIDDVIVESGQI